MPHLKESYRLRYHVYCQDKKFLDPELYPDGIETDKYDDIAAHFYHVENNRVVGTMRIIPWSEELSFPTADRAQFLVGTLNALEYPINTTAEISRLCLSRGCGDRCSAILAMFKDLYAVSKRAGITHWFSSFERSLYKVLKKYSVRFNMLSDAEIDYYGKVYLYGVSIVELESEIQKVNPGLYEFLSLPDKTCR
jgi:N-acyl-L-homoserine lactone synthetase